MDKSFFRWSRPTLIWLYIKFLVFRSLCQYGVWMASVGNKILYCYVGLKTQFIQWLTLVVYLLFAYSLFISNWNSNKKRLPLSLCYLFSQNSALSLWIPLQGVFLLSKFDGHSRYITGNTKVCQIYVTTW